MTVKLCECGCGEPAPLAKNTDPRWGHVKGQPIRFVRWHSKKQPTEQRFWKHVDKHGPLPSPAAISCHPNIEGTNCWLWVGTTWAGYGVFSMHEEKTTVLTHRYSFFLKHGHYPQPMGLHKCDVRLCCNPDHIFEGDSSDNAIDMVQKGRGNPPQGIKCGRAKLTNREVLKIRELFAGGGVSKKSLAQQFDIDPSAVSRIISKKRWGHL